MTINQDGHENDGQTEGVGPDGSIPETGDGIALTTTEEPSNFEPEEDALPESEPDKG